MLSSPPSQIEFGIVYSCVEDKMYTARRGRGAFCNGEPIRVSSQEGEQSAYAPAGGARATAVPLTFPSIPRHQSVAGSDRDGLQEEPGAFQNHVGQHPNHPDHPRPRVRLTVTHASPTQRLPGATSVKQTLPLPGTDTDPDHSVSRFLPQHSLSGQRRCQHVPGGLRLS